MPFVDRNAPIVTEYARCGTCRFFYNLVITPIGCRWYPIRIEITNENDEWLPDCGYYKSYVKEDEPIER
jgi:hypothetical protein